MHFAAHAPLILSAALALVTAAAGCNTQKPVQVQAASGTDFSKYRTYAIRPGSIVYPGASEAQRADIAQRVQDALAIELEGRGLAPQPDEPEMIVTYTVGAQPGAIAGSITGARPPVGVDAREPGGNPYDEPGAVRSQDFPDAAADADLRRGNVEGNLVIDLIDGKTRRLVWRATSALELRPDRAARAIDAAISSAFAKLPLPRRSPYVADRAPTSTTAPAPTTEPGAENRGR